MKKSRGRNLFLIILGVFILLLIIALILLSGYKTKEKEVKVGFVMSGACDEIGWNGSHYIGIKETCEELEVELVVKENIKEFTGQCTAVVQEMVDENIGIIILNSYGYSEEVKELVKEYPEVTFYVNSSEYHDDNMTSYFVRMYQARYLSGIIAGMKTKSDQIGYVAAMPNNEVNRGINAFTLGVKRVNEDAKVLVTWTGSWDNEQAEKTAAKNLVEEGKVDVLTYHQNQNYVVQAAEELGVYSIGYHAQFEGFSPNYLTSAVYDFKPVYGKLIREYLKGNGNSNTNYWIGMEADAVNLSAYSSEVTEEIIQEVEKAKKEILTGKSVFSGVIYDIEGNLHCDENEAISDEMLLEQSDWYIEGVEFYE